ncbi:hypothetical protein [Xanthomarina sp.]|uniref:hypothetical protein n=1 Tax=Xanthomarina sp. TaxID=1931211 RepID=UPI002D01FFA0|nr:hypothetical protein [Xanthomarina sp.]HLV39137.1 hypothetical protein [Xanthomarina sp.]
MLGVFSCQKDDSFNDSTITKPAKNNVIVKRVTLDEIKTNNQLQKTLNKIDKYLDVSKSKDTNSRIYSNDGSFVILTDEIAQAITHNSEAYTFKIETPILPEATFENLIIEKRENQDKFYFYIYSYKTITLANNTEFTFVISIKKIDQDIINMDDFYDTINSSIVMVNGCMYFTDDHGNSELIWCFGSNAGGSSNEGSTGISGPQVNMGDWVYFSYGSEGCYRTRTFSVLDSYNTYEDQYGDASWHNVTEIEHNVPCPNGIGWNNDGTNPGNNGGYDNEENDPHFNDGFTPIGSSGGSTTPSNNNNSTVVTLQSPPRNFAQELFTCFSGAGMLVNISDLTFFQQRNLAYYLQKDNSNFGTNCSSPQALAFALEAAQAMKDGGEVDFENEIILDPSFCENEILDCVYDTILSDPNSFTNAILNNFLSEKTAKLKFEVGNIPAQLDGTIAFTYTNLDPDSTIANGDVMTVRISSEFLENASALEIALVLMHEPIHAELLDRSIQLDIITHVNILGHVKFSGSSNSVTLQDMIFNMMIQEYRNYNGGNSGQWNHDAFTTLGYRDNMIQDLIDIHPLLNNSSDDFLTNVNSDPNIVGGPYTIPQIMDYYSWVGLEETQDYINNVANDSVELSKKQYIEDVVNTMYNQDCN